MNRYGHSLKMSDVSDSLRSLTKNERIANFFERIAHSLIVGQKTRDSLGNPMSEFLALIKSFFYNGSAAQLLSFNVLYI